MGALLRRLWQVSKRGALVVVLVASLPVLLPASAALGLLAAMVALPLGLMTILILFMRRLLKQGSLEDVDPPGSEDLRLAAALRPAVATVSEGWGQWRPGSCEIAAVVESEPLDLTPEPVRDYPSREEVKTQKAVNLVGDLSRGSEAAAFDSAEDKSSLSDSDEIETVTDDQFVSSQDEEVDQIAAYRENNESAAHIGSSGGECMEIAPREAASRITLKAEELDNSAIVDSSRPKESRVDERNENHQHVDLRDGGSEGVSEAGILEAREMPSDFKATDQPADGSRSSTPPSFLEAEAVPDVPITSTDRFPALFTNDAYDQRSVRSSTTPELHTQSSAGAIIFEESVPQIEHCVEEAKTGESFQNQLAYSGRNEENCVEENFQNEIAESGHEESHLEEPISTELCLYDESAVNSADTPPDDYDQIIKPPSSVCDDHLASEALNAHKMGTSADAQLQGMDIPDPEAVDVETIVGSTILPSKLRGSTPLNPLSSQPTWDDTVLPTEKHFDKRSLSIQNSSHQSRLEEEVEQRAADGEERMAEVNCEALNEASSADAGCIVVPLKRDTHSPRELGDQNEKDERQKLHHQAKVINSALDVWTPENGSEKVSLREQPKEEKEQKQTDLEHGAKVEGTALIVTQTPEIVITPFSLKPKEQQLVGHEHAKMSNTPSEITRTIENVSPFLSSDNGLEKVSLREEPKEEEKQNPTYLEHGAKVDGTDLDVTQTPEIVITPSSPKPKEQQLQEQHVGHEHATMSNKPSNITHVNHLLPSDDGLEKVSLREEPKEEEEQNLTDLEHGAKVEGTALNVTQTPEVVITPTPSSPNPKEQQLQEQHVGDEHSTMSNTPPEITRTIENLSPLLLSDEGWEKVSLREEPKEEEEQNPTDLEHGAKVEGTALNVTQKPEIVITPFSPKTKDQQLHEQDVGHEHATMSNTPPEITRTIENVSPLLSSDDGLEKVSLREEEEQNPTDFEHGAKVEGTALNVTQTSEIVITPSSPKPKEQQLQEQHVGHEHAKVSSTRSEITRTIENWSPLLLSDEGLEKVSLREEQKEEEEHNRTDLENGSKVEGTTLNVTQTPEIVITPSLPKPKEQQLHEQDVGHEHATLNNTSSEITRTIENVSPLLSSNDGLEKVSLREEPKEEEEQNPTDFEHGAKVEGTALNVTQTPEIVITPSSPKPKEQQLQEQHVGHEHANMSSTPSEIAKTIENLGPLLLSDEGLEKFSLREEPKEEEEQNPADLEHGAMVEGTALNVAQTPEIVSTPISPMPKEQQLHDQDVGHAHATLNNTPPKITRTIENVSPLLSSNDGLEKVSLREEQKEEEEQNPTDFDRGAKVEGTALNVTQTLESFITPSSPNPKEQQLQEQHVSHENANTSSTSFEIAKTIENLSPLLLSDEGLEKVSLREEPKEEEEQNPADLEHGAKVEGTALNVTQTPEIVSTPSSPMPKEQQLHEQDVGHEHATMSNTPSEITRAIENVSPLLSSDDGLEKVSLREEPKEEEEQNPADLEHGAMVEGTALNVAQTPEIVSTPISPMPKKQQLHEQDVGHEHAKVSSTPSEITRTIENVSPLLSPEAENEQIHDQNCVELNKVASDLTKMMQEGMPLTSPKIRKEEDLFYHAKLSETASAVAETFQNSMPCRPPIPPEQEQEHTVHELPKLDHPILTEAFSANQKFMLSPSPNNPKSEEKQDKVEQDVGYKQWEEDLYDYTMKFPHSGDILGGDVEQIACAMQPLKDVVGIK
ncbi:hypothetical protein O6H91_06G043900 [Diphasiastrum complanatum]|uniref:Uncharacterized protein n=1 Tax=Diphasiastrum complanatum TaxID=34168 RepID=A0ACC2DD67_DIPCM|nr:hypothetical protein O6H91_06G043900 [Diphasiastrum complanatum]